MTLAGLTDPGPPIPVILAPEGSPEALRVGSWVSGYALGAAGPVVLLAERGPTYPDRSLEALLHHEVTHVLIDRAARGQPVPRWFHEGVAMAAARAWNLEDRTRLAYQTLAGEPVRLAELDRWFSDPGRVSAAYAVAGAFVRDLLRRHGQTVTGKILARLARGERFPAAYFAATGETLGAAEEQFWRTHGGWRRWVPFLTSSVALWMLVTTLALVAIWYRRRRDAELHARWEAEEQLHQLEHRRRLLLADLDDEEDAEDAEPEDGPRGGRNEWVH
jgi:hypothetical protein